MPDSLWPRGLYSPWNSPGQNTGVGSLSLLQWIFPTQESNQGSPALQVDSLPTELLGKPFPASGSSPVNCLFISGGQSFGASTSASVLPVNIQSRFPLGLTGWISLQFKGLSRVFSNTTAVQKHQFFSAQSSLWSNSHVYMTTRKTIGSFGYDCKWNQLHLSHCFHGNLYLHRVLLLCLMVSSTWPFY